MKKIILTLCLVLAGAQNAQAGFSEGATAYNNKNYALALREITPLATAGNADAENLLGLMYYMGQGVLQNYKQAMLWLRKAAVHGNADAQYVVGAMYYTGNSVPKDSAEAVTWFVKSAEQGHADAQQVLGLMYCYHIGGVPHDVVIAYMLWNLSAAHGSVKAAKQRDELLTKLSQEQVDEGQALSAAWRPGTPLPRQSHSGADKVDTKK